MLLVAVSRYQNFLPTLPEEVKSDIYSRMMELLEEEKDYCDEGNYSYGSDTDIDRYV